MNLSDYQSSSTEELASKVNVILVEASNMVHTNPAKAKSMLEQVLSIIPNHFGALYFIGQCHLKEKNFEAALKCFQQSLTLCPEFYYSLEGIAQIYSQTFQSKTAVEAYEDLIRLGHKKVEYYLALGRHYGDIGEFKKAFAAREEAIKLAPDDFSTKVEYHFNKYSFLEYLENDEEMTKNILTTIHSMTEEAIEKGISFPESVPELLHSFIFCSSYKKGPMLPIMEGMSTFYRTVFPELCYEAEFVKHWKPKKPGEKIKLGIASCFLTNKRHSVRLIFYPILNALSSEKFDITLIDLRTYIETHPFENENIKIIDTPVNALQARKVIEEQEFDVLFYTDIGMESVTYSLANMRLAPVQCVAAGHPITTGIPTMDFYISSKHLESENAKEHYSEKLYNMPTLLTPYDLFDFDKSKVTKTRKDFGLEEDQNVYACLQTLFKFHSQMDEIFKNILERDPKAVILIFKDQSVLFRHLIDRIIKHVGPLATRIRFISRLQFTEFLQLLSLIDVSLDTSPFSGGNTSLQTLYLGVPLVTMPDEYMRSRQTSGLYSGMGVLDCVVSNPEEYVNLALKLGTDKEFNQKIREKILKNNHKIFKDKSCIQAYEEFFLKAGYGEILPKWLEEK